MQIGVRAAIAARLVCVTIDFLSREAAVLVLNTPNEPKPLHWEVREPEDSGQLGELAEGRERPGMLDGVGQPPVGRGQQVGLADAESAVEV